MDAKATLAVANDAVGGDVDDAYGQMALVQLVGAPTTPVVNLEISNDGGTTYVAVQATNLNTGVAAVNMTAAGVYQANISGAGKVRAKLVSVAAGSFTAYLRTVRLAA